MGDLFEDHASIMTEGFTGSDADLYALKPAFDAPSDKRHRNYTGNAPKEPDLDKSHLEVYRLLSLYPQSAEDIEEKMQKKKPDSPGVTGICLILMELCLEGHAVQVSPGQFCRKTD